MTIPPEGIHPTRTLITGVTGDLIIVDIAGVRVGDLIFFTGHHIRRVLTRPVDRPDRATGKFAFHTAPVTHSPDDPRPTGTSHANIGSAFLVLRPVYTPGTAAGRSH